MNEKIGLKIVCLIRDLVNSDAKVSFHKDWGGNSFTITVDHRDLHTHSHVGLNDSPEKHLEKQTIETLGKWLGYIKDGNPNV